MEQGSLRATRLRCEHRVDPLGIGSGAPVLDWQLEAADPRERGLSQSAYQVVAESDGQVVWDSGRVESSETTEVRFGRQPLRSGQVVHWKVRVWDQDGRASPWSDEALFSVGLLDPSDWQASWIGWDAPVREPEPESAFGGAGWIWFPGDDAMSAPAGPRFFRGRCELPAQPLKATLHVSVDNYCEVFCNGVRRPEAPGGS